MKNISILAFICLILFDSCTKQPPANNSNNQNSNLKKAIACFTYTPNSPTNLNTITFDATCSQYATSYLWDVDKVPVNPGNLDQVTMTQKLSQGSHTIKLMVAGTGGYDTLVQTVNVTPAGPVGCFTITPSNSNNRYAVNTQLTFDATCSTNTDPSTVTWDFGDDPLHEHQYHGLTTTYTYTATGTFTVDLEVTDPTRTTSGSASKTITVY